MFCVGYKIYTWELRPLVYIPTLNNLYLAACRPGYKLLILSDRLVTAYLLAVNIIRHQRKEIVILNFNCG